MNQVIKELLTTIQSDLEGAVEKRMTEQGGVFQYSGLSGTVTSGTGGGVLTKDALNNAYKTAMVGSTSPSPYAMVVPPSAVPGDIIQK